MLGKEPGLWTLKINFYSCQMCKTKTIWEEQGDRRECQHCHGVVKMQKLKCQACYRMDYIFINKGEERCADCLKKYYISDDDLY